MRFKISRREFVKAAGLGLGALAMGRVSFGARQKNKRPNIIFILTDDQRFDEMGCGGHPWMKTPNLDRLAREGVLFKNAFVTTALCSPSRASFLTGCYVHTHGVFFNAKNDPDPSLATFPELLQKGGYETAFIGKWHMKKTDEPRAGFDRWVSFVGQGHYYGNDLNVDGKKVRTEKYLTDELTDYALEFIKKKHKKPFMLYLSHKAIHGPQKPAKRHENLYTDKEMKLYDDPEDNLNTKPLWQARVRPGWEKKMLGRKQCVAAVDDGIGRILDTLKEQNILDDTAVIFTSDNGHLSGEHGLWDKRAAYEESIRIPLIMRYPKLARPNTVNEEMVLNIDLAPTLLDLAGAAIAKTMQGRSWLGVLKGRPGRKSFFYECFPGDNKYHRPNVLAVRTKRWKFISYPLPNVSTAKFPTRELYDLQNDPKELNNLVGNIKYMYEAREMAIELERLKVETRFRFPPKQRLWLGG
jgi:N-acetylglucosamine-6-sulfatase